MVDGVIQFPQKALVAHISHANMMALLIKQSNEAKLAHYYYLSSVLYISGPF